MFHKGDGGIFLSEYDANMNMISILCQMTELGSIDTAVYIWYRIRLL